MSISGSSLDLSKETLEYVRNKSRELDLIDVHQCLSVTKNFDGITLSHLEELKDDEKFESLDKKDEIVKVLQKIEDEKIEFNSRNEFIKYLKIKLKPTELNLLIAKDTESIPLKKDIKEYFEEEVKPHLVSAWMDESTFENIGYEIPFTRYFYEYKKLKSFEDIMGEIRELESSINDDLKELLA